MEEDFLHLISFGSCKLTSDFFMALDTHPKRSLKPWVAKIVGTHPTYGLSREFLPYPKLSFYKAGLQYCYWAKMGEGLFEFRNFLDDITGELESGFLLVKNGMVREITDFQAKRCVTIGIDEWLDQDYTKREINLAKEKDYADDDLPF